MLCESQHAFLPGSENMHDFDWQPYTRTPILDVPSAVALGHALLSAVPKPAPDAVKSTARNMRRDVGALQKAWASQPADKREDPRPLDTRFDGAWSALRDRLSAATSLTAEDHSTDAERAAELLQSLFPTGADFLKLPYAKQWAESDKRIRIVRDQGLQPDIERLAGAAYWKQVETLHQAYGDVLGITRDRQPAPAPTNLLDPLRDAQRSIGNYVLQVAAAASHDASFAPRAERALAPVDAMRDASARRASPAPSVPPVTPTTPLPPETN
jgi:hypothetical protein